MFVRSKHGTARSARSVVEPLEGRRLLSASPVSAPLAADPGGSSAVALDLGVADKVKLKQADTIGTGDAADVFKITVTGNTTLSATVKGVGKPGKVVKPTLVLSNAAGTAATAKKPTSAKHTLGPGTYFIAVNGQETGTADYKLTLATKPYKGKKAPTFTSPGGTDGDGGNGGDNGGGTAGGTITGSVNAAGGSATDGSDTYRFRATQTGTFELPATFAADTFWNAAPVDNATTPGVGGGGIGVGDGTLSVVVEAGVDYVFNVVAGATPTNYSVTLDSSFTNVQRINEG